MSNIAHYDLFCIGAGSGGVRASRIAAGHGANVGVADDMDVGLGGTCVNVGCVPKKLFAYGSTATIEASDAKGYGWDFAKPDLNWERLISNKNDEIARLNGIYEKMLNNAGVTLYKNRAKLLDPNTIQIGEDTKVTADKILVAVGGWPVMPNVKGSEYMISSNEAFYLKKSPKRAVVIGSGYIAVEFTGIFAGYGSQVDLCVRKERILRGFDKDVALFLEDQMAHVPSINLRHKTEVVSVEKIDENSDDMIVTLNTGEKITCDLVLAAIGRAPKFDNLGLKEAGVELSDNGFIGVDRHNRTSQPNIFAVGDCTDTLQLTPVALAEGHCFADTQFGGNERFPDTEDVATAVFSHPNIGTCGLSEETAVEKYGKVRVYKSDFRPLKHTMTTSSERSLMKIVVDDASDRVVGMHMVGDYAGEIMQGFAAAIKMKITKKQLDSVIGIHPTSAEEFVTMRTVSHEAGN
eukprot:CAMPEP_0197535650 /NCGR_PEP_ID=MMETSP1318-20131121/51276_1 /TAXON_ID=552666 /ORGANISM="Partenskyella glossopodia, Strain RCC365" /LENGTH=462 /DNA_ID=CAMNT_0043093289 /DNA_START=116 /DNA_END=1504 /DNA_ORIENTATION=+